MVMVTVWSEQHHRSRQYTVIAALKCLQQALVVLAAARPVLGLFAFGFWLFGFLFWAVLALKLVLSALVVLVLQKY